MTAKMCFDIKQNNHAWVFSDMETFQANKCTVSSIIFKLLRLQSNNQTFYENTYLMQVKVNIKNHYLYLLFLSLWQTYLKKKITELRQNGVTKPEKVINNSSEF